VSGLTLEKEWEAHGLLCRITLHPRMHTRCGYVRVAEGHPFYKVAFDRAVTVEINKARMSDSVEDLPFEAIIAAMRGGNAIDKWLRTPSSFVRAHGGITYSDALHPAERQERPGEWWFGFDCGHAGDYTPFEIMSLKSKIEVSRDFPDINPPEKMAKLSVYVRRVEENEVSRDFAYEGELLDEHYWTLEEVIAETEKMAEQLAMIGLLGVRKKGE